MKRLLPSMVALGILIIMGRLNSAHAATITSGDIVGTPNISAFLGIGSTASGTMAIISPDIVNTSNGAFIGDQPGGNGAVVVQGPGAEWNINGGFGTGLRVGNKGVGQLDVFGGAKINSEFTFIARENGSVGTMNVFGTGTSWTNTSQIQLATEGIGTLNVFNQAQIIGNLGINQGDNSTGFLNIYNGGRIVSSGTQFAGIAPNSQTSISIKGDGSSWNIGAGFAVGINSPVDVSVESGANLSVAHGMGTNKTSNVTVKGSDSSITSGFFTVQGNLDVLSGGGLDVSISSFVESGGGTSTAKAKVSGTGSKWETSSLMIGKNGKGKVTVSNDGVIEANNVEVNPDGKLDGNGTVVGDLINKGGVITPGLSPGILSVIGDFIFDNGILGIEVGGLNPGQFDVLDVTGDVTFGLGSIIQFSFINDFLPSASDPLVDFLSFGGSLSGFENVAFDFIGAAPGFDFDVIAGPDGLAFDPLNDAQPVPEPSTFFLLGTGFVSLVGYSHRRRNAA